MRLIDADELTEVIESKEGRFPDYGNEPFMAFEVKDYIRDCETVDAVEVVRCKDCKHFTDDGITGVLHVCGLKSFSGHDFETRPDDFCSYGERMQNE